MSDGDWKDQFNEQLPSLSRPRCRMPAAVHGARPAASRHSVETACQPAVPSGNYPHPAQLG